jgi:MOSC domain-containing protein
MSHIGDIASIVRYPVKSMAGEILQSTFLAESGLAHDRLYAFESSGAPPGMLRLTGRERREMLRYEPVLLPDGTVDVRTPTGQLFRIDSQALLVYLQSHIPDVSSLLLTQAATPQTDVRPLSLISLQTVQRLSQELGERLDLRRFRANLHLDLPAGPFTEDSLVGRSIRIGKTATIKILERDPRCRLITYDPQAPHSSTPLFTLMKLLDQHHEGRAGVYASITASGPVQIGDPIQVLA